MYLLTILWKQQMGADKNCLKKWSYQKMFLSNNVLLNYNFVSYWNSFEFPNCKFLFLFQFLLSRPRNQFRNHSKMIFVNLICTKETVWIQKWILQALEMANLTESNIMIQNPTESHQVQIWPVVGKSSRNSISKYIPTFYQNI